MTPYVAPSWSWASTHSQVDTWRPEGTEQPKREIFWIEVVDIQIDLASSEAFGAVTDARLQVACQLLWNAQLELVQGVTTESRIILEEVTTKCFVSIDYLPSEFEQYPFELFVLPVFGK
jgi:hypothetical protein